METFNYKPRLGATPQVTHRTISIQFGDGYLQAVGDGINTTLKSYQLEFIGSYTKLSEIANFLDRHGGFKPFLWMAPRATVAKTWIAKDGYTGPTRAGANVYSLQVTFTSYNDAQ